MNDWYDKGEGSEHMKKEIAQSAFNNPVPHPMCIGCEHKNRQRVGIIVTDLMGGDAHHQIVSEEDYNTIIAFNPTKTIDYRGKDEEVFNADKFEKMVEDYFFDAEEGEPNEKVLKEFCTQTFAPEKIDLSKYNIIGMLTFPAK